MPSKHEAFRAVCCSLRARARPRRTDPWRDAGAGRARRRSKLALALPCLALLLPLAAGAVDASTYLLMPVVDSAERELELRCGAGSSGPNVDFEDNCGVGLGTGLTESWFSEIAVSALRARGASTRADAIEWENIVQFAEQGEWPVDTGMVVELDLPRDPYEGASVRVGPLLQKDFGALQVNGNLLVGHHLRQHLESYEPTQWRYQAQVKYRYQAALEFGVQAFGNFSSTVRSWADRQQQLHTLGPVLLGRIATAPGRALSYNVALLAGLTDSSPRRTLRFQLEYEF